MARRSSCGWAERAANACKAATLLLVAACSADAGVGQTRAPVCRILQRPTPLPVGLNESSGIAASSRRPGVYWTHNDSGEIPALVAIDAAGRPVGGVRVVGAEMRDWEDVSRGPCPAGNCLYIGDTGDNDAKRKDVELYRIPEPAPGDSVTAAAERFPVRYPGGPRDAESLFVLPSGEVYVITRGREHRVTVYRYPAPLRPDTVVELEPVRDLSAGPVPRHDQVTGADASPDGEWVAVRTYSAMLLYRTRELLSAADSVSPMRVDLRPLKEAQGEAISLGADGAVVLTTEGGGEGLPGMISVLQCTVPESAGPGS